MNRDTKIEYANALEEQRRRLTENKLVHYEPYPKQAEFHALGKTKRERALIAANQSGKTYCAAMEMAMHLSGQYPKDWKGKRFERPVRAWVAGVTSESVRDAPQKLLLGAMRDGTGSIPKAAIKDIRMARGIADAVDTNARICQSLSRCHHSTSYGLASPFRTISEPDPIVALGTHMGHINYCL
jgi:phage terminase large subunit-like protein